MKDRIIKCFNRSALTYDQAAIVQTIVAQRLVQSISKLKVNTVLEIGCGTGQLSSQLVSQFPTANFVISDIAPEMVNVCQKRFGNRDNIKTIVMDGERLFENSFDLITSSMVMHWFIDIEKSISTIISRLTSKGHFHFAMLGENSLREWREMCSQYNVSAAMPMFPSANMLQIKFPEMDITTEIIPIQYPNTYEFLNSLKKIGAIATHQSYSPISAGKLRKILRNSASNVHISYEIIYGKFVKS